MSVRREFGFLTGRPGVVILKMRENPLHAGAIGIARSMGRLGVDVHVIGERGDAPLAHSRYVTSVIRFNGSRQPPGEFAQSLVRAAPSGHPLLIPIDDIGANFVQQQADILSKRYNFARLPVGLVESLIDKATLYDRALIAGVSMPGQDTPTSEEDLERYIQRAVFPVVVKARDPEAFERTPGVRSVQIVGNAVELRVIWGRHMLDGRSNCLIQEFIPGGPESVWMINGYANKSSLLLFAATGRKIRQLPRNTGATSLGVCERNNEVISLTRQFVQRVGYRGIIDVGWRFDERDGRYKLLDFNPRIGATFRLFAHDDLDVVRAHYLDIMERTVDNTVVPDGRIWINEAADVFSAAGSLRTGDLSVKGYFRSLQQVNEPAWLAVDDFVPGMLMVWATLKRLLLYGLRRWRRAAGGSGYPRNSTLR